MFAAVKFQHRKLLLFVLLSLADLVITCSLIARGGGAIYETNPVANAWLDAYGWKGLALFKAGMVVVIVGIAVLVSVYRPQTSARLLGFACLTTFVVVVYSCYVARAAGVYSGEARADETQALKARLQRLEFDSAIRKAHWQRMMHLCGKLTSGERNLKQVVDELRRGPTGVADAWLALYRSRYPRLSDEQYLGIFLVQQARIINGYRGPAVLARISATLEDQFVEAFGVPYPAGTDRVPRGNAVTASPEEPVRLAALSFILFH
jgi:hypothetical protein